MGAARHVYGPVTTAKDGRFADGGLIAVQGPTAIDTRTGVLVGPGSTALVTGTSATAPMTVAIAPHHWVTTRGAANGPYLGALEAATTATIPAAPAAGAGTRIDVVYSKQQDAQPGIPSPDGTTAPLYGVVSGVPGGAKPALPVGAEELATVAVAPSATATNGAGVTITNTARQTTTRGGVIPVKDQAERVALQTGGLTYPTMQVLELDKGRLLWHDGTQFRYDGDRVTVASAAERTAATAYTRYTGVRVREADTRRTFEWDGTRWLLVAGPVPAVTVRRTTGASLTVNAWSPHAWEAVVAEDTTDTSMWASANPSRLVAPVDGLYELTGSLAFGAGAGERFIAARKNGGGAATYRRLAKLNTPAFPEIPFATNIKLAAGEYVDVMYYTGVTGDTVPAFGEIQPRAELRWGGNY